jgi:hypothetical protein
MAHHRVHKIPTAPKYFPLFGSPYQRLCASSVSGQCTNLHYCYSTQHYVTTNMRFETFRMCTIRVGAFHVMIPYKSVVTYWWFCRTYCLHLHGRIYRLPWSNLNYIIYLGCVIIDRLWIGWIEYIFHLYVPLGTTIYRSLTHTETHLVYYSL